MLLTRLKTKAPVNLPNEGEELLSKILEKSLEEYGVKEVPGNRHNDRILMYAREIGEDWVRTDETSWCSIFLCWAAANSGTSSPRTKKATARSWLKVGEPTKNPKVGDVVVFWRDSRNSWKGHVGIFISKRGGKIYVLGGNQDNKVCIKSYDEDRLLGYRRMEQR